MLFSWKDRHEETVFLLFVQVCLNNWHEMTWATLFDNDFDL